MTTIKSSATEYGRIAQGLHWIVAILVFTMGIIGTIHASMEKGLAKSTLLNVHIIVGIALAVLVCLRILWRLVDQSPDPPSHLGPFRLQIFKLVHIFIYLCFAGLFISGISLAITLGTDILPMHVTPGIKIGRFSLFLFHMASVISLIGLITAHIGGVLSYQFTKSDVLSRMGITWFINTKEPKA